MERVFGALGWDYHCIEASDPHVFGRFPSTLAVYYYHRSSIVSYPVGRLAFLALPATVLGVSNAVFSIAFPYFLGNLHRLLIMTSGFLVFSLMLSTVTAWMTATAKRDVAQHIVRDMTSAFDRMHHHGYTIGDALTRFQDVLHMVDAVIGLVRDIPYTVIIWCGTVWYVSRQPTVAGVLLGVITAILLLLTPFVRRVRNALYRPMIGI